MSSLPAEKLPRRILFGIILIFAVLSIGYSIAIPLRRGPDEPAHFIYIRSLATEFTPPPIAHEITPTENSTESHEGHQPPLYYALMTIPFALLKALGVSIPIIWRVLRLAEVPIGMAWIYFVYRLSKEFFGNENYALAATTFTAFIPTSAYMAGMINNDVLISLLFTCALIPILAYFKSGQLDTRSSLILGAITGLAILTKAQGLVILPTFLLVSLLVWRRRKYANTFGMLGTITIVLGMAALVGGWWFVRSEILYGTLMPHSLYKPIIENGPVVLLANLGVTFNVIWGITSQLIAYFWTPFWLIRAYIGWETYFDPICAVSAIVLIGNIIRLRRKAESYLRPLGLLCFVAVITYIVYLRYVFMVDMMANQQGRLFLPLAAIAGIIFVLGADGWVQKSRAKRVTAIATTALMIVANIAIAICGYIYYASGGA